ncbi:MAG: carboxymuconolactone decarboxylase family protein [Planctomycetaceae bacterium]
MRIPPLSAAEAPEKVAQTYERLRELIGGETPVSIQQFGQVEPFLRDFFMNFKRFVCSDGALDQQTKGVIAYAAACQAKCGPWIDLLAARGKTVGLTDIQLTEIAALVATNAMYNTFFKFRDLSGSELFSGMGVGLRAHTLTGTSFDEKRTELISTAVSVLNGCRPCTSGHVESARQLGLSDEQLLEAVQCAATIAAACQFTSTAGA